MRIKKLSPRLLSIAEKIKQYKDIKIVADIGTDHAHLPIHLIHNGICSGVLACDIREGPLSMAKRNIQQKGMSDKIRLILSDGLRDIVQDVDCVVISGMGGQLIIKILSEGQVFFKTCQPSIKLIVQPMTHAEYVKAWLCENGWDICDQQPAVEDRRTYTIITSIRKSERRFV